MAEANQPTRKKTGRPPKSPDGKPRITHSMRLRGETRERLIEATKRTGRSISEEIEHRVEQSFEQSKSSQEIIDFTLRSLFGREPTRDLAQRIALALNYVEGAIGKEWDKDPVTRWECKRAALEVVDQVFNIDQKPPEEGYRLPNGNILQPIGQFMGHSVANNPELPTLVVREPEDRQPKPQSKPVDGSNLEAVIERTIERTLERLLAGQEHEGLVVFSRDDPRAAEAMEKDRQAFEEFKRRRGAKVEPAASPTEGERAAKSAKSGAE